MKKHNKISIAALILVYFIINVGWGHFQKEVGYKGGKNQASSSIKESKARGCFVEELTIFPKMIQIKGTSIQIKEIWIEKRHELSYVISLLPTILEFPKFISRYKYQINLNFVQNDVHETFYDWFLVIEGKGSSFGNYGGGLLTSEVDGKDWNTLNVFLTQNWKFENAKTYLIKKRGDKQ